MAIREGRWRCSRCESEQLGRHKTCQSCGAPVPVGVRYYLPDDAPVVTDAEQLKQANAGPDKQCKFCDSRISASEMTCPHCGGSLDGATREKTRDFKPGAEPHSWYTAEAERGRDQLEQFAGPAPEQPAPAAPPRRKRWFIAAAAGTPVALGLVWFLAATRPVPVEVSEFRWERTITIEDERTVSEEDWSVPAGGRRTGSFRAIHRYDRVVDHTEQRSREVCENVQTGTETYTCGSRDKGNGYFEDVECSRPTYSRQCHNEPYTETIYRNDPVYATKYRYDIERWFTNRTQRASGTDREPVWPPYTLAARERAGPRGETYVVTFRGPKRMHHFTVDLAQLQALEQGQRCIAKINAFGGITSFPDCKGYPERQ